uniref:Ribosome production factor 2 homolog n=1 Tax=Timema bartmani TaxID=61472 RepID=A0A7R9F958_9NEOP|nr:unnamed protein product [Timema bartmani]
MEKYTRRPTGLVRKPTTHKGKKVLLSREPKLIENTKKSLFIQGRKTTPLITNCLKDLFDLKKPDAKMLQRKNDILPFEDATPLENFSRKHLASLFFFASHNKKRPNNLIIGRTYQHQVLDMIELGVEKFQSLKEFKNEKVAVGLKPCLLFAGELFDHDHEYKRLQNLLVDMFHREPATSVRLQGLEHVIMVTAVDSNIYFRSYKMLLKKSGTRTPRIELEEIGPSIDFKLRRSKLASMDLFKLASKKPKELKAKKVKNISRDKLGSKHGQIHIPKQNIGTIQTRKMKGLRKSATEKKEARKRKAGTTTEATKRPKLSEESV